MHRIHTYACIYDLFCAYTPITVWLPFITLTVYIYYILGLKTTEASALSHLPLLL